MLHDKSSIRLEPLLSRFAVEPMNFQSKCSPDPFRDGGQAERWKYFSSICELFDLIRSNRPYDFSADCEVTCEGIVIY